MKVGIYPGTFDPVHVGHLAFALASIAEQGLDMVVFLVEEEPRNKHDVTPLEQRLEMLSLTIKDCPELTGSTLDSRQFTVTCTLPEIRQKFPGSDLCLLIGSDVAYSLPQWNGIEVLLDECSIILGLRDGDRVDDLQAMLSKNLPTLQYHMVKTDKYHIRSSQIKLHGSTQYVDREVALYIKQNNLYGLANN